jgi:hypothetical protein
MKAVCCKWGVFICVVTSIVYFLNLVRTLIVICYAYYHSPLTGTVRGQTATP